ncbi:ribosome maturation factor RimM [Polycyclovorans algicola]|uniref:ribosome maturation factor RimM n=1 Tax=Polycyclovorans algicola TaxID=616992 RepID=UPI0004A749AA|nr:ribosome maturation factor RimM [Polycyclovorans algicola]
MERITLGHVSGVYGIKGWLRITPQTRPAERILEYRRWWIGDEQGFMSRVVSHRMQGNGLVVELLGRDEEPITDRAIAQTMIGKSISVLRSEMPPLAEGEYYWVDLLGLKVLDEALEPLGVVTDVFSNGAQDVLTVSGEDKTHLIPFVVGPIVVSVSMADRQIVCRWSREW